jgi:hypothetical protein
LLPHLVMPAHHDVRSSDVFTRRLHGRHGVALPSREMSGRMPTQLLSVVQTTEPTPPLRNRIGFAG